MQPCLCGAHCYGLTSEVTANHARLFSACARRVHASLFCLCELEHIRVRSCLSNTVLHCSCAHSRVARSRLRAAHCAVLCCRLSMPSVAPAYGQTACAAAHCRAPVQSPSATTRTSSTTRIMTTMLGPSTSSPARRSSMSVHACARHARAQRHAAHAPRAAKSLCAAEAAARDVLQGV